MVMVGPSLRIFWTAIPMLTSAARIGMIQTTESHIRLFGLMVDCGMLLRSA
jgi:hypothetical protein